MRFLRIKMGTTKIAGLRYAAAACHKFFYKLILRPPHKQQLRFSSSISRLGHFSFSSRGIRLPPTISPHFRPLTHRRSLLVLPHHQLLPWFITSCQRLAEFRPPIGQLISAFFFYGLSLFHMLFASFFLMRADT